MTTIIKATERNSAIQAVAFNFDDMASKANQYLDKIRAEAAQILAQAKKEAIAIHQRAEQEGRKAGQNAVRETARQQAEQLVARQMQTLLPALGEAVQHLRDARQAWLTHWEKTAVHLAAAIASRLVRQELARRPEVTLTLVREALELAAGSPQIRIHLHPADHQALGPQVQSLLKELALVGSPEVLPDPQITAGGCRVETRFGVIDQQFESQLARIEEELT